MLASFALIHCGGEEFQSLGRDADASGEVPTTDGGAGADGGAKRDAVLDARAPDGDVYRSDDGAGDASPPLDASDAQIGTDTAPGTDAKTDSSRDATIDDARDSIGDDSTRTDAGPEDGASNDVTADVIVMDGVGTADVPCSKPFIYYRDKDGDGFGDDNEVKPSCVAIDVGWSTVGGDCRDDLPEVRPAPRGSPNPPAYSGMGYPDANRPGGISFDYDCSGTEDADPANPHGANVDCPLLLTCVGVGYVPVNPARTGMGIDPRCGSTTLSRCSGVVCTASMEPTTIPYRCR